MKNRPFFAARTALALAAVAALSASPLDALALGLGRLSVQSALGEGMRAEIDVTSLTPEEAASLQVRIASPEAYRAAGVDYNAVLAAAQASVVRRADGRAVVRVTSDRAVQEPFIEVILEINSSSGRLVREFTLLFDPPGSRNAPPPMAAAPVAPVISAAPIAAPAAPPPATRQAPAPAAPAAAPTARATAPAPSPAAAPVAAAKPAPAPAPKAAPAAQPAPAPAPAAPKVAQPSTGKKYEVRAGDTLYRVASRTQSGGVSLDQMLVGLYRSNPDAFIESNVNKLRAGSVLSVPAADEVRDVTAADAKRLITAQSADFSAYRARLAQGAPAAQTQESTRQSQGKVQSAVDDRKQAAAPSPDKLKLTGAPPKASAPDPAADARKANDARVAELTRNVEELKKLQQGTVAVQAPAPVAASAPVAAASAPAVAASAVPPAASLPAPVVASKPMLSAPVPVPAPAAPEASLIDSITGSPLLLPGVGILGLALAGLAAWRLRGRFSKTASETSFLESRMQPDSFFGASGGQRVDTRDGPQSNASSMGYSLSQLDAIGDVDPVAEADVYLAYGRDLQAEEILKEAMRATPDRLAVRTKLLEVYAKRRDTKGFEMLATQLYALTKGTGTDWAHAQELGRQIDSENQLYQPGGHPEEIILDGERVVVEPLGATTQPHSILSAPSTEVLEDDALPQMEGGSLDLDLDLGLGGDEPPAAHEATQPVAPSLQRPDQGLDFDFRDSRSARAAPAPAPSVMPDVDFDSLSMDLDEPNVHHGSSPNGGDTTIDFSGFGDLRVDAPMTAPVGLDDINADGVDPLARKLELAEEFRQIGDLEGARDLLEEVLAKATGTLRAKARSMLDNLG